MSIAANAVSSLATSLLRWSSRLEHAVQATHGWAGVRPATIPRWGMRIGMFVLPLPHSAHRFVPQSEQTTRFLANIPLPARGVCGVCGVCVSGEKEE